MSVSRSRPVSRRGALAVSVLLALPLAGVLPATAAAPAPATITVLSSRADLVSGGDALVEVALPAGARLADLRVRDDARDVTRQFARRADGRQAVEAVFSRFFEAQRTARTQAGRPMVQGITPSDLRVQMAGADAAVATFHLGTDAPARRSLVFRRTAGQEWKVIHWHASSSPRPAGSQD